MVSTRRKPAVPELHRMLEQLFTLRLRCGAWRVAASFRIAYREDLRLAFLQRKFRNHASVCTLPQRLSATKVEGLLCGTERCSIPVQVHFVRCSSIVERRFTHHPDVHRAPYAPHSPVQVVLPLRLRRQSHRHEIFQLRDSVLMQKSRHQKICQGPIKFPLLHLPPPRPNLESSSFFIS